MNLIDTHCHIDFSVFDEKRSDVITEAARLGVSDIVVPGVTAEGWGKLLQVVSEHHACRLHPALGLHPCFMDQHQPEDLDRLEKLIEKESVCAVGEIGLDLFIPEADLHGQLFFFEKQLELAAKYNLPVLLHVRKAHDQVLKLLRRYRLDRGGAVHAFSGSLQQARQYIALGFKLGLGGTVTYERARRLRRIVDELDLSHFVLETDAPDMPLAPYRNEPNRPARVKEVADVVASLKGITTEQVAVSTARQACTLFCFES
ncbi:TatD family hydrolase [Neptuniibacter caesariensis]|uniref:Hydrolase, TatD family protein n=1 Tax=Neptuniibacter caesariensis TaxID=207954 RepID=A0A7U8C9G3_NEPCE|nr:TatD family hydrolase [Neptuniibacter caesariensis]EAR63031.1 hydrolase, TatD family protein [Oceanospirillum sp. MED92] [Neptuniibacter caesariensis]